MKGSPFSSMPPQLKQVRDSVQDAGNPSNVTVMSFRGFGSRNDRYLKGEGLIPKDLTPEGREG